MANTLNMVKLIEKGIEEKIKHGLREALIKKHVDQLKLELNEVLDPLIESLTLDGVEAIRDYLELVNDYHIYLSINNGEKKCLKQ